MAIRKSALLFVLAVFVTWPAAATDQLPPIAATVCDITSRPQEFDGKIVRVRAQVVSGFEISAIGDRDCQVWLSYPGAGVDAMVSFGGSTPQLSRPEIVLKRDRAFRQMTRFLEAEMYPRERRSICMGCRRYEVTATMIGRVDHAAGRGGFGHLNGYKTRLLLQSVAEVSARDNAGAYDPAKFSATEVRFPEGTIRGTLLDAQGKPLPDQEVNAVEAEPETGIVPESFRNTTDQKGRFRIDVPAGTYVVGINTMWSPSSKLPYPRTFFPGVTEQTTARKLEIRDRQQVALQLRLGAPLLPRTIPVTVKWPDGQPVADANVWLEDAEYGGYNVVGHAVSHTDADGRFTLVGFENRDYVIHANIHAKPAYVPHCAPTVRLNAEDATPEVIPFVLSITGQGCR